MDENLQAIKTQLETAPLEVDAPPPAMPVIRVTTAAPAGERWAKGFIYPFELCGVRAETGMIDRISVHMTRDEAETSGMNCEMAARRISKLFILEIVDIPQVQY